jgi:hypothetical protein
MTDSISRICFTILKVFVALLHLTRQRGVHFERGVLGANIWSFHAAWIGRDRLNRLWRLRANVTPQAKTSRLIAEQLRLVNIKPIDPGMILTITYIQNRGTLKMDYHPNFQRLD